MQFLVDIYYYKCQGSKRTHQSRVYECKLQIIYKVSTSSHKSRQQKLGKKRNRDRTSGNAKKMSNN